jgi:adenylate kinase
MMLSDPKDNQATFNVMILGVTDTILEKLSINFFCRIVLEAATEVKLSRRESSSSRDQDQDIKRNCY